MLNEENKIYGFNVYIGSLAGVSTGYIAGIILGNLGSDNSDVGFFTLALTLASPLTLLPTIIGTTYFKSFATNAMISKKLLYGSIILTVLSGLLFVAVIKLVVNILYPEEYSIVSLYASWLALAMCAHGMGDLFNKFLGAHGQGKQLRNGAFICGTVLLLGSLIGIPSWGINAAITTRIVASFSYFISMFWFYYSFTSSKGCSNVKSINN